MSEKEELTAIDLFAGVGGIRLAFERAGFKIVYANDFDKNCKITYDLNFGEPKLDTTDIWEVNIENLPYFDVLLAGFPCQPFSVAGYKKGFRDEKGRGNLFFRIAEILDEKKPPAFMLENVKHLVHHDKGRTFKIIKKTLREDLGYKIKWAILNGLTHGNIPQNRERIFIVGFKDQKKALAFEFPKPIPLTRNFREFLEQDVPEKYYYNNKPLYEKLKAGVTSEDTVYQWRWYYLRENKKGVCPALIALMGTGGNNVPIIKDSKGIRKLTPRECFSLQGFPADFKLPDIAESKLYYQAGNSVIVPIVERIAFNMKKVLVDA